MRNAGRILAAVALVYGVAWLPAARACLNDTRTSAAEVEFRSRYNVPAPVPTVGPTILGVDPRGMMATVLGAGFVAGGLVLVTRRRGK